MVGKLIYLATKKQLDNTLDLGDKNREKKTWSVWTFIGTIDKKFG